MAEVIREAVENGPRDVAKGKRKVITEAEVKLLQTRVTRISHEWYVQLKRRQHIERILQSELSPKELARAQHMADLEVKIKRLKEEVREMQVALEDRNVTLAATELIVNCTGCWAGRPTNAENITEERVKAVEEIAERLRRWWTGQKWRVAKQAGAAKPEGE